MPTHTDPASDTVRQLYTMVISELEPDLLPENISSIPETWEGETEDQHMARMNYYKETLIEAFRQMDLVMQEMKGQSAVFQKNVLDACKGKINEKSSGARAKLHDSINPS